ncbi:MAG: OB-fold domain-containing protein [Pseudomonadota bacterium]
MNKIEEIPIRQIFWTTPSSADEEPQLIGSKCLSCGEIFFPKKEKNWCNHCYQNSLQDIKLSRKGKIVSFSVVMQQPGGGFYKGPVPYAYGVVDLEEGVRIQATFKVDDFNELIVGREARLIIDILFKDEEGHDVSTFKFEPI